ncbi:HNH endonuclease [Georgenia sp. Z1491]|uniref:HNH endonuclease signature motif containing protein n=1 Tax=Georgenia sp. Z1491 TaxID=3416707 RepID=UPI003CF278F0
MTLNDLGTHGAGHPAAGGESVPDVPPRGGEDHRASSRELDELLAAPVPESPEALVAGSDEANESDMGPGQSADAPTGRTDVSGLPDLPDVPDLSDLPDLPDLPDLLSALVRPSFATEREAVDHIQLLEQVKAASAAGQALAAAELARVRGEAEVKRGVPFEERGKGLAAEVALARRETVGRGSRHLGLAQALVHELPCTLALMSQGLVSEWRATILARETAGLSVEDRRRVDAALADDLPTWGDKQVQNHARKKAHELDDQAAQLRHRRERNSRRVSVRPADGSMAYLTAYLPMIEAVRVHASLHTQAATIVNAGGAEERSAAQVAADLLVEHVTGASASEPRDVDLTIVMTDRTLAGGDEPAWLPGQGPLSAQVARDEVRESARVWFRRLWTDPATGGVVSMESQRRTFGGQLRRLVLMRDDGCTEPYCDAPAEHVDHAVPHAEGGATSFRNGSGLCAAHNYAKQNPGWRHRLRADGDRLDVWTPTGHRYSVPRSPFPYRIRPMPPSMTKEQHEQLGERVAARVRRLGEPPPGGDEPAPEP